MKHNTMELLHLDAIKRATKDTLFKVQDSLEYPLCYTHAGVTEKIAIEFHIWMRKNDIEDNAEKYANFTDEDMFQEFLKTKQ